MAKSSLTIGVLALQGAFNKHIEMLKKLNVKTLEVRDSFDLAKCEGLIIPGGESTTLSKHISFMDMRDSLILFGKEKPIFGTCAGIILMSKEIVGGQMTPFNFLNISIERNAFGRQAESFETLLECRLKKESCLQIPAYFIRAPKIIQVDQRVTVLSSFKGEPVLVEEGLHLGSTFHPELSQDPSIHLYFLKKCQK